MATVHVPVRIRVDADRLRADPDALSDAVSAAVGRALARSRGVVPVGEASVLTVGEPDFRWSGDPVGPDERAGTERLVRAAILAAGAGIGAPDPTVVAHPPDVVPGEVLDRRRLTRTGYAIPSYDSGGDDEIILVFDDLAEDSDLSLAALRDAIHELSDTWGEPDAGAHPGVMWVHQGILNAYFVYGSGTLALNFAPRSRNVWQGTHFELRPVPIPEPDRATLQVVARFTDGDLDAYKEFIHTREGDEIAEHISGADAVEAEVARRAQALATRHVQTIMDLTIGRETAWYAFPEAEPVRFDGSASLLPMSYATTRSKLRAGGAQGTGSGGGSGTGEPGSGATGATGGGAPGEDQGGQGEDQEGEGTAPELRYGAPIFGEESELVCESFLGEPSLDAFPEGATLIPDLDTIAHRLQIEPCHFAGQFCLMAAAVVRSHASGLADAVALNTEPGVTELRRDGSGNLGEIHLRTGGANVLLHRLAGTVPLLANLARDVRDLYRAHSDRISGMYEQRSAGWELHFLIEFGDAMDEAVSLMFGQTCRLLMLQLLAASRAHIDERLAEDELARLAHAFYTALLPELITVDELNELHRRLDDAQDPWEVVDYETGYVRHKDPDPDVTYVDDRGVRIHDARGRQWTLQQLDDAAHLRRGFAEELEPLIKHIRDMHEVVTAMRGSEEATKAELRRILSRMQDSNDDVRSRVLWSWEDAFKYGPIDDNLPGETPADIGRNLHGIHLLAHNELAPHFGGSEFYGRGVRRLFEGEHAIEVITSLVELGVLVVVSVLCPPAGFVLGVGLAAAHLIDIEQKVKIRDALLSPEQVADLAELDVEEFVAVLGLALAVIPESGSIIRGAYRAGAAAIEEGAISVAGRVAMAAVRRSAVLAMRRALEEGFAKLLITELVKVEVMNAVMSRALAPLTEQIQRESLEHGSPGGVQGALALIAWHRRQQQGAAR